jgi:hypothetical protein
LVFILIPLLFTPPPPLSLHFPLFSRLLHVVIAIAMFY